MAIRDKEVYSERDRALYEAYKEARKRLFDSEDVESVGYGNMHRLALLEALKTRQNRFWITQDRTYRILRLMKSGKAPRTWGTRIGMYDELIAAYERLRKKRMFAGMPLRFVASFVTYEPSSGFFMSYSRAGRAVYNQYLLRKAGK